MDSQIYLEVYSFLKKKLVYFFHVFCLEKKLPLNNIAGKCVLSMEVLLCRISFCLLLFCDIKSLKLTNTLYTTGFSEFSVGPAQG